MRVTALHCPNCPNLDAKSEVGGESHATATVPPVGHRASLYGFWRIENSLPLPLIELRTVSLY
jgi:hypothetical protein